MNGPGDPAGDNAATPAGVGGAWAEQPWRSARQPPWWPEGEAWPPDRTGLRARRVFARRIGCLFAALLVLFVAGPAAILWHLAGGGGPPFRSPAGFAAIILLVVLVVTVVPLGRGVRRWSVPIGDLVEAANRVETGDLATRVPERPWAPPEIRALPRAFNSMAARLEADERQRRRLLADIAHELRTPLSVLQGELEAIVDGVHPADEEHLEAALDETRVLARLIEDLRTLALAEARTLALHREPTDLAVLAEDVATAFAADAGQRGVSVDVDVADAIPLLDVDPVRIREVLVNLVANALRYSPPGSRVRIAAQLSGPSVNVSVVDQGPGIPPDLLPSVFDRFVKSPESRGSGLGLAIARQLVEAHGGRIEAQSNTRGTTISFELPVSPDAEVDASGGAEEGAGGRSGGGGPCHPRRG